MFDPWVEKISRRKKWQPTPVFLPGKSHGQRSLAGYSPWGHKQVRHNLAIKQRTLRYTVPRVYHALMCKTYLPGVLNKTVIQNSLLRLLLIRLSPTRLCCREILGLPCWGAGVGGHPSHISYCNWGVSGHSSEEPEFAVVSR